MKAQLKIKGKISLVDISETLEYLYKSKHISKISFISEIKKTFYEITQTHYKDIKFIKLI